MRKPLDNPARAMQATDLSKDWMPLLGTRDILNSPSRLNNLAHKCGIFSSRTPSQLVASFPYLSQTFPHKIPHAIPHRQGASVAYIRKFRDGWRAEVQRHGVRKTAVWPTRTAAKAWATKVEAEIAAGLVAEGKTFKEAVDRYIRDVSSRKRGKRPEALRLQRSIAYFPKGIADITAADIAQWRDARLSKVSASSVLRESRTLRHLFRIARREWHWISNDPWSEVTLPKHDPPRHQRWSWRDIARILRSLGYRHGRTPETKLQEVALAFMISLRTALRAGEVLQVSPATLKRNVLTLSDTKTERRAQVPLTRRGAALCALVRGWSIDAASLDALFRKVRDRCLIEGLRFHDARATALTFLARKVDVLTLSRISRHKDLKMLSTVYYRESAEEIAKRLK